MSVTTSVVGVSSPSGTSTTTSPANHHPPTAELGGLGQERHTGTKLSEAWPTQRRHRARHLPRWVRRLAGPFLLLVAWQLLSTTGIVDDRSLAAPWTVLQAGQELASTGELFEHLFVSLRRAAIGLAIGVSTGVVLAVIAGLFRLGEDVVDSAVQVLRAVPVLGLLPLIIIWFGIGEAAEDRPRRHRHGLPGVHQHLRRHPWRRRQAHRGGDDVRCRPPRTRQACDPSRGGAAVPRRPALRMTGAWLIMIVAEQINAKSGLGYLVNKARTWFRTDIIVLCLVVYGILGLLSDSIVRLLERRRSSGGGGSREHDQPSTLTSPPGGPGPPPTV